MDTAQPLISVIVPVYNTAPFLRKCLDSICDQTYRNLEIICINDGSTDSSAEILAEYATKDSRFIIINQENAGQAAARNKGLQLARGEWITGVDSDDYIEPDTYEYCINSISGNNEVKLIVFPFDIVNGDTGQRLGVPNQPTAGLTSTSPQVLYETVCYFVNKLWHRDTLSLPGATFPVGMWFEDVVFFYRTAPYQSHILYLSQIKYHYMRYAEFDSSMDKARALPHKNIERVRAVELALEHHTQHHLPQSMQHLSPGLLLKFYNELRVYLTPETEQTAWDLLRNIINRFNLLTNIAATPELALCYYLPPCALNAHEALFTPRHDFELLLIADKLYRHHYLLKLKKIFTWGKKRDFLKTQESLIKQKLRKLRFSKRQAWRKHLAH